MIHAQFSHRDRGLSTPFCENSFSRFPRKPRWR
jgi:hypothetical protein